jgi:hypothetical protein
VSVNDELGEQKELNMDKKIIDNLNDCLDFDPFEGDFGDQGDKTFKDKIVKGRKEKACFHCEKKILVGEIHRNRIDLSGGEILTFRWCNECCDLMRKIATQNGSECEEIDDLDRQWDSRSRLYSKTTMEIKQIKCRLTTVTPTRNEEEKAWKAKTGVIRRKFTQVKKTEEPAK